MLIRLKYFMWRVLYLVNIWYKPQYYHVPLERSIARSFIRQSSVLKTFRTRSKAQFYFISLSLEFFRLIFSLSLGLPLHHGHPSASLFHQLHVVPSQLATLSGQSLYSTDARAHAGCITPAPI